MYEIVYALTKAHLITPQLPINKVEAFRYGARSVARLKGPITVWRALCVVSRLDTPPFGVYFFRGLNMLRLPLAPLV